MPSGLGVEAGAGGESDCVEAADGRGAENQGSDEGGREGFDEGREASEWEALVGGVIGWDGMGWGMGRATWDEGEEG